MIIYENTKIDVRKYELEMCIWIGKYVKNIYFPLQLLLLLWHSKNVFLKKK